MSNKWFMILVMVSVLAVGIFIAVNSAQLYVYESGNSGSYTYTLLLNAGLGMMLGGAGIGIITGAIVGLLGEKSARPTNRRGAGVLFDDWGLSFTAMAGVILLVTGIMLGGIWSPRLVTSQQAIASTMNMHFIGIVIMLFGGLFVLTRMFISKDYSLLASFKDVLVGGKSKQYLPSHGWAVWALTVGFFTLCLKGAFLLAVHWFSWPNTILVVVSGIHDLLALGGLVLAVVALVFFTMENSVVFNRFAHKVTRTPV